MRHKLILAGLVAALAVPSLALAQPGCVRSNNQTTGTGVALGAIGGALIGNAIGGRHSRGTDTALGAVAGGVAGGALANQHNDPCGPGYYRPDGPPPPAYGPGPGPDAYNYGPPPVQGSFWYGAPQSLRERYDFVQARIIHMRDSGRLAPRDFRYDQGELDAIRRQDANLRARDGGRLSPPDRDYVWQRLNTLSQRLRWNNRWGY